MEATGRPGSRDRAIVVDDGHLNRECLVARLADHDIEVGQAWDLPSLLREVTGDECVVILLNIGTTDSDLLLEMLLDLDPRPTVVVFGLSAESDAEIVACAEAGVDGMHLRSESFESLLTLVRDTSGQRARCSAEVSAILMRRVYTLTRASPNDADLDGLTARETEILGLMAQGMTNKQIASRLYVTVHTVKNHVHSVLTKLGVNSRFEAVTLLQSRRYQQRGRI